MARRRALDVCETWQNAGGEGGPEHGPLHAGAVGVTTTYRQEEGPLDAGAVGAGGKPGAALAGVATGVTTTHNPRSTRFTRDAQGFYEAALHLDPGHVPTLVRYGQ